MSESWGNLVLWYCWKHSVCYYPSEGCVPCNNQHKKYFNASSTTPPQEDPTHED